MRGMRSGVALLVGGALAAAAWAGQGSDPILLHPGQLTAKAPDVYRAKFTTTKGDFVVEVTRGWSPLGADRFYNLVKHHYYDRASFFRVVTKPRPFVVQFGISADPKVNGVWQTANIKDDPVTQHNVRGTLTFATAGPGTRTTQVFISLGDNTFLDSQGFSPFGKVVEGMEVVEKFYGDYGDGMDQGKIQAEGKAYLDKNFPKLDSIVTAVIVEPAGATPKKAAEKKPSR